MSLLSSISSLSSSSEQNFHTLSQKYNHFKCPQHVVIIDNQKLDIGKYWIKNLDVRLSASMSMNSCEFDIVAKFNPAKSKMDVDLYKELKPGKSIDVKLGYQNPVGVFKGYINALSFAFAESGVMVHVQCLEIRGMLVNSHEWIKYPNEKASDVIYKVLKKTCGTGYKISPVKFAFDGLLNQNLQGQDLDDFQFISNLASETNYTFCSIYDRVIFSDNLMKSVPGSSIKFKWGESLLDFSVEIDLSQQCGSVQVLGIDPHYQNSISSLWHDPTTLTTESGKGEFGKDYSRLVAQKNKVIYSTLVVDKEQAMQLAQRSMEMSAAQLVHCRGSTIGIPDLRCGIKVSIDGMGHGADGTYFLTAVNHRFDERGYQSSFEGVSANVQASHAHHLF